MSLSTLRIAAGCGGLLLLAGCVSTPPEEDPIFIKLTELEERMDNMERVMRNESLVELAGEMELMREEARALRGQVETLQHESEQARNRQRDQYLDIDRRLQAIEGGGEPVDFAAPVAGAAAGAAVAAARPAAGGTLDDRGAYEAAFELLKSGRYDEANAAFTRFLASYPDSSLAGHAQYWLAETYYVQRDFETALAAFNTVVETYPGTRKMPDALLKVGYCNYENGDYAAARGALEKVVSDYPDSTSARLAAQRLEKMRAEGR